ncbi:MAG: hypothetical protein H7250_03405 [Flavobacterium sp.]|nr:hypothetical protein [Flavobacterium sp.]
MWARNPIPRYPKREYLLQIRTIGTFAYADQDANGKPIGLAFTLTTGAATTGNLTVTLKHEPNKSAAGVSTGNITNAGGATDASVTYPIVVE